MMKDGAGWSPSCQAARVKGRTLPVTRPPLLGRPLPFFKGTNGVGMGARKRKAVTQSRRDLSR